MTYSTKEEKYDTMNTRQSNISAISAFDLNPRTSISTTDVNQATVHGS